MVYCVNSSVKEDLPPAKKNGNKTLYINKYTYLQYVHTAFFVGVSFQAASVQPASLLPCHHFKNARPPMHVRVAAHDGMHLKKCVGSHLSTSVQPFFF